MNFPGFERSIQFRRSLPFMRVGQYRQFETLRRCSQKVGLLSKEVVVGCQSLGEGNEDWTRDCQADGEGMLLLLQLMVLTFYNIQSIKSVLPHFLNGVPRFQPELYINQKTDLRSRMFPKALERSHLMRIFSQCYWQ